MTFDWFDKFNILQLESAYAQKERDAQIREKEERITADITADLVEQAQTEREMKEHVRAAEAAETAKVIAAAQYQKDLIDQVTAREDQKEFAYQQYLKEKLMVDEVVRKIYEEDARVRAEEMAKKEEMRRYIDEFKEQQQVWNEREKGRLHHEAEKIKLYDLEQQRRLEERKQKTAHEATAKLQVQEALAEQLRKEQAEKDQYESVVFELLQNEQEERARLDEIKEMQKRINDRFELQRHHAIQMQMKMERQMAEADEEEAYRRFLIKPFNYKVDFVYKTPHIKMTHVSYPRVILFWLFVSNI